METVYTSSPAWEYITHQVKFLNQSHNVFKCKLPVAARQAPSFPPSSTLMSGFKDPVAVKGFQYYSF